jgi:hypothetical protein
MKNIGNFQRYIYLKKRVWTHFENENAQKEDWDKDGLNKLRKTSC